MVFLSLYSDPVNTGIGFAISLTGIPAYYIFIHFQRKPKWFQKFSGQRSHMHTNGKTVEYAWIILNLIYDYFGGIKYSEGFFSFVFFEKCWNEKKDIHTAFLGNINYVNVIYFFFFFSEFVNRSLQILLEVVPVGHWPFSALTKNVCAVDCIGEFT